MFKSQTQNHHKTGAHLSDSQVSFVTQTISKAVLSLFVSQSNINMKANTTAQSTSADQ